MIHERRLRSPDDFEGKVVVVTGGSSGIGRATVTEFAQRGASMVVIDMTPSDAPEVALSLCADVTDSASVNDAVDEVDRRFGRLDVAVCCAGIFGDSLRTTEVSDKEWARVIAVNATGTFYVNRAVIPLMARGKYGRIVNVASTAGKEGNPRAAAYSAAKAAVMAFTQSIGRDVAPDGILANCVAPAAVETPLMASYAKDLTDEQRAYMVSRIPLGRMGEPAEIARLIAFLGSDDMTFSTGAVFDASGGRAAF